MSRTSPISATKPISSGPAPHNAKFLSVTCQQIIVESCTQSSAKVVVRSHIGDPQLWPIIDTHKCNNVVLFPSSVYADMVMVVSEYIYQSLRPGAAVPGINVCNMDVEKPVIPNMAKKGQGQYTELEINATLDGDYGTANALIRSVKQDGTLILNNAHCTVSYESIASWRQDWAGSYGHVLGCINELSNRAADPLGSLSVQRMQRADAYDLFKSFVDYGPAYNGMSEVIFDGLEGTAKVDFQTSASDYCGPYHLDNSCHLSGFLCNAYDRDRDAFAYVSHGWSQGKISRAFTPGERLRSYVKMRPEPKDVLCGDVFVLEGEGDEMDIVGVWEGIKFKRIPRKVLDFFLPPPKKV